MVFLLVDEHFLTEQAHPCMHLETGQRPTSPLNTRLRHGPCMFDIRQSVVFFDNMVQADDQPLLLYARYQYSPAVHHITTLNPRPGGSLTALLLSHDFAPSSSPTKLFAPMVLLKHTPKSVSLPPSPTRSLDSSDESIYSTKSSTPTKPNFTKALKSLPKPSITLPLHQKASQQSLSTTPVGTPTREVRLWPFRPTSTRATTPVPPAEELADHFEKLAVPTNEQLRVKQARRDEAAKERVRNMRAGLVRPEIETPYGVIPEVRESWTVVEDFAPKHQRFDSASHEHGDDTMQKLQELHDARTSRQPHNPITYHLPPLEMDFLYWHLFRMRHSNVYGFDCIVCSHTSKTSLDQGPVWMLIGCQHFLHAACFLKLRDIEAIDEADSCHNCERLKRMIKLCRPEEMRLRHERMINKIDHPF